MIQILKYWHVRLVRKIIEALNSYRFVISLMVHFIFDGAHLGFKCQEFYYTHQLTLSERNLSTTLLSSRDDNDELCGKKHRKIQTFVSF